MKTKWILLILLISGFVLTSCSESSDPKTAITGTWKGTIVQPEFGELITVLNINSTTLNAQNGTGSFTSGDISVCDDTQFNCIPLACTFNLSLKSMSDKFYEMDQMLIETNSTCGDGIFEITYVNDNNINVVWYEELYPDNRATGKLTKQ